MDALGIWEPREPTRRPEDLLQPKEARRASWSPYAGETAALFASNADVRHRDSAAAVKGRPSSTGSALRNPNPLRLAKVKRWDPQTRMTSTWDGLRYDPELYSEIGDCVIYLYAKGCSQRSPPFRVSLQRMYDMHCGRVFSLYHTKDKVQTGTAGTSRDAGVLGAYEIYIPAPTDYTRENSFRWHLTTRNFFAFLLNKPLVGTHLGHALVDLQDRLDLFRTETVDNFKDFATYLESSGYLNFGHHADYALAVLHYAEHFQRRELWIDAFCHCVGMCDILGSSLEFEALGHDTKSLITRASQEMGARLHHISNSLNSFLQDELPALSVGLGSGARAHLDMFCFFLNQYHADKFGSWPPRDEPQFAKSIHKSMHLDFLALYDYLVDRSTTDSMELETLCSGDILALQNLTIFNQRQGYSTLPHPLPMAPSAAAADHDAQSNRRLSLVLRIKSRSSRILRNSTSHGALPASANTDDRHLTDCSFVKAYQEFERESMSPKDGLSLQDARRIRWILIYSILQMLISATHVPSEVRSADGTTYPLCVKVSEKLPWEDGFHAQLAFSIPNYGSTTDPSAPAQNMYGMTLPNIDKPFAAPSDPTLHSSHETNAKNSSTSRSNSFQNLTPLSNYAELASALSARTQVPQSVERNSSKRRIKSLSFINFGSRRNSNVFKAPRLSFQEIIVHGYGNGLNLMNYSEESPTESPAAPQSAAEPPVSAMGQSGSTAGEAPISPSSDDSLRHNVFSDDSCSNHSLSDSSYSDHSSYAAVPPEPLRLSFSQAHPAFKTSPLLNYLRADLTPEPIETSTLESSMMDKLMEDMMCLDNIRTDI